MDKLFIESGLKNLVKIHYITIDNTIFRFHYRVTALILFAFSLLVTGTQFFGTPIRCIQSDDIPQPLLESFCWIEGTFTLPKALTKLVGDEIPHPGIDKYRKGDEVIEHSYYQWVCFVLLLQACMFLIPHIIWKYWEGGRMEQLLCGLNLPILDGEKKIKGQESLVQYFVKNRAQHMEYVVHFFVCEVLNFVNVIGQMYFIDRFLGGEFTTYGTRVVEFVNSDQENREDPMVRIFPRVTKCTFYRYGPSGDVQKHDALCILPLNIVNEKIYIFIWFWFVLLAIFSGIVIGYHMILFVWPRGRFLLIKTISILTPTEYIDSFLARTNFGDWFVVYLLGLNIDSNNFRDLMEDLATALQERDGYRTTSKELDERGSTSKELDERGSTPKELDKRGSTSKESQVFIPLVKRPVESKVIIVPLE